MSWIIDHYRIVQGERGERELPYDPPSDGLTPLRGAGDQYLFGGKPRSVREGIACVCYMGTRYGSSITKFILTLMKGFRITIRAGSRANAYFEKSMTRRLELKTCHLRIRRVATSSFIRTIDNPSLNTEVPDSRSESCV